MNEQSYTTTVLVDRSPDEVFDAINDVRGWWSGEIDGSAGELGAEFTYRYEDLHRSRQRVTEFVPGKRIVWHVVDADLSFVEDRGEWTGTDIVFDLVEKDGGTAIHFTHEGLVPRFQCHDMCSTAWGGYVNTSLREFITAR